MPQQVTMGAMLQCSFGVAPSTLVVLPLNRVLCEGPPAADIMDHIPLVNILPFGMCNSPANPEVARQPLPRSVRLRRCRACRPPPCHGRPAR